LSEAASNAAGDIQKTDSEYMRKGTCSIFVFVEPLAGWRYTNARFQRRVIDWAEEIKYLLTECYPGTGKILLILDNLNTHVIGSLYKRFPASEARGYTKRLEIHYTPKHGNWLNIAEIELNVMTRQCLLRRLKDISTVKTELSAWAAAHYKEHSTVTWHFTSGDARNKLLILSLICMRNKFAGI